MKSFGLWYKEIPPKNKTNDDSKFALHVNFWSLEDIETDENIGEPYLDIGIKITNYENVEKMTFFCPFNLDKNCIQDLSEKFSKKNNANIIFNDDCEIETKDNFTIIKMSNREKLLIFPLFRVIKNICKVETIEDSDGTKIIFNFQEFHKYVAEVSKLKNIKKIYIRFRIKDITLRDYIYFDSEPLNKSFESAFSGTRIIDFKVNEKRDINDSVRTETIVDKQNWADFDSIHFLAMMPSSYGVTSFCKEQMTCRELEDGLWDDYLGTGIRFEKGHVLAYHWRKKQEKDEGITDFSCLLKIDYSKTKVMTIFSYALSVVALGMIGSILVEFLSKCEFKGCSFIIAVILLISAIVIGKRK